MLSSISLKPSSLLKKPNNLFNNSCIKDSVQSSGFQQEQQKNVSFGNLYNAPYLNFRNSNIPNIFEQFEFSFKSNNTVNFPSEEEQIQQVKFLLSDEDIKNLQQLEEKGILSDRNSDDNSSVLENLYKIATMPRVKGLDNAIILKETINALNNPYSITQKFADIFEEEAKEIRSLTGEIFDEITYKIKSRTCGAASIEFTLAKKRPAEYARFAEGLSSPNYSVKKEADLDSISTRYEKELKDFNKFKVKYNINKDNNTICFEMHPDKNAILRAMFNKKRNDDRSSVSILMQSTFLNFVAKNTYNSKLNSRANISCSGLYSREMAFIQELLFKKPFKTIKYMEQDSKGYILRYNKEEKEIKRIITQMLDMNEPVIICRSFTDKEERNKLLDASHAITITGYSLTQNGKYLFTYKDTDGNNPQEQKILSEEEILPYITSINALSNIA